MASISVLRSSAARFRSAISTSLESVSAFSSSILCWRSTRERLRASIPGVRPAMSRTDSGDRACDSITALIGRSPAPSTRSIPWMTSKAGIVFTHGPSPKWQSQLHPKQGSGWTTETACLAEGRNLGQCPPPKTPTTGRPTAPAMCSAPVSLPT